MPGELKTPDDDRNARRANDLENARQCAHDDRILLPPAPRVSLPGNYTESPRRKARSSYHSLPARSNERPQDPNRSEERRVGKECRSRGSPEHEKKKNRK